MSIASLVLVAFIWGITNALIGKASKQKLPSMDKNNKLTTPGFLNWITNPLYVVSLVVNLSGSLLFFYKLANSSKAIYFKCFPFLGISISGPLVNSMTLAITAISGNVINKEKVTFSLILGVILVIFGTSLATI